MVIELAASIRRGTSISVWLFWTVDCGLITVGTSVGTWGENVEMIGKVLQYSLSAPPFSTLLTTVDLYGLAFKWLICAEPSHFIALYHTFSRFFRDSACAVWRSKRHWENLLTLSHIVTARTALTRDCLHCNSTMTLCVYSVYKGIRVYYVVNHSIVYCQSCW